MSGVALGVIAAHLDSLLQAAVIDDYPPALNGVQMEHRGPAVKIAAAVDCSARTIRGAIEADANLLLVHHGLFWGGLQPLTGPLYARVQLLLANDIALYSAHLPLDAHETYGNSRLLARQLGLTVNAGFGRHETIFCGVRGEDDLATSELLDRVREFSRSQGGVAIATPVTAERRTKLWAVCSGAGAGRDTIAEAMELGIDTLIVGEGPHWTAVEAPEDGLVIIYAGHYATETLGIRALAEHVGSRFCVPWAFIEAPTGL